MDKERIVQELEFKAVRSSGAGGQHVNKVSSKVELYFDVAASKGLSENEKERIYTKIGIRLTKENVLILYSDTSRSQHKNKELVIQKFLDLIRSALTVAKKRRKTKPKRSAVEKRLKSKLKKAQKKSLRGKPKLD
ncbi:peptide chain release factor 1 [Sediminicola sp. YIK13]|uniref:alternative ribosome rescue aminoacyl-tRNA hydrolase ArfB n=1 Tax=Sediminicola sp. YIK13 TaxID=1453352 RepID=UPI0007227294|nr:alternative ribosome rescue aminoacyl-tRNA hydrolase ArfB [Sediminicola sp. YIK13]ALM08538.1 peptide chain release factor 1 [Sediminicola sp. YIK13]